MLMKHATRRMFVLLPAATLLLGTTACATSALALNAPFPVSGIPASLGKKPKSYDCPSVDDPIVSLGAPSSYRQDDPTRSTIDKEARQEYLEKVTPLREYNQSVVKIANAYTEGKYDRAEVARCAEEWMGEWADAGALSNLTTGTVQLHIGQTLSALSYSMMQVEKDPAFDSGTRQEILDWLSSLSQTMIAYVNGRKASRTSENNIRYWNGLGAATVGAVTNDKAMFDWGLESVRIGIRQIASDGTLPGEMHRAARARQYHFFATMPMIATAELAAANGIDLYSEENGALHRLVKLLVNTYDDPSYFEQKTGAPQVVDGGKIPANMIAWLFIYDQRFPSQEAKRILAQYPDLAATALGGDVKLLYGR